MNTAAQNLKRKEACGLSTCTADQEHTSWRLPIKGATTEEKMKKKNEARIHLVYIQQQYGLCLVPHQFIIVIINFFKNACVWYKVKKTKIEQSEK